MTHDPHPTLRVPRELRVALGKAAERGYPHEVCGLLIGRHGADAIHVERLAAADNLRRDRPRDRYTLDPRAFLEADRAARREGLDVVGVWHSHPDHPAEPSKTDLEEAWEGLAYVIVSVRREGAGAIRSWRLADSSFTEQTILEVR